MGRVQPSLEIGPAGDRYEQEAERVADLLADGSGTAGHLAPVLPGHQISRVQRSCPAHDDDVSQDGEDGVLDQDELDVSQAGPRRVLRASPAAGGQVPVPPGSQSRIATMRSGGMPLPPTVRGYFEPRFGCDFGAVRIHTDQAAGDVARSVGARAFTVGTDLAFAPGQYAPGTAAGRRLLAHELTHVIQQGGAGLAAHVIQCAGDPSAIPAGLSCPTDLSDGAPAGTDLLFAVGGFAITPVHTAALTTFRTAWVAGGGSDDVTVHGYASTLGDQAFNWALSCQRAEAVRAELVRLGIPAVRVSAVAHGTTTEFSASRDPNQRVVVLSRPAGVISLPVVLGLLTARDDFAGRSPIRFGVGEVIDLGFFSFPPATAAGLGGLEWHLVSGGGALAPVAPDGTGTFTAPAAPGAVVLELRVAAGATAGRVVSRHAVTIVAPSGVRMKEVPGTAPGHMLGGAKIPVGTWGAGFQADVFIDPRDVSFQGVTFGEGTVAAVVTPAGSFLRARAGKIHPANTFGPAHGGNAVTGTQVSPPQDNISSSGGPVRTLLGVRICGTSEYLWAIPWEFSVAGGPRTPFAHANHHVTSTPFCDATIEKGGAGPFCRTIDGTAC